MMKQLKNISCAVFFFLLISSCQKDDICPAASETTPRLVIEFYDLEDPEALKAVENLVVVAAEKGDTTLLGPITVNRVEIPLRTDRNFTTYRFIANAESEDEEDLENEDVITFSYDPTTEYLNRACGFKVNFLGLNADLVEEDNEENWINSVTVTAFENNIVNDSTAHISIIH